MQAALKPRDHALAPASHSTIDPDFVAAQVRDHYPTRGPVSAQLLYRGMNDVYIVRDDSGRRALRIWRAGTRSLPGVLQELDFLDFLDAQAIPVSKSLPTLDGDRFIAFNAQEGSRPAVLYTWAPGAKFGDSLDVGMAERIGCAFGELHLASRDYRPAHAAPDGSATPLVDHWPALLQWIEDRPEDIRDYARLTQTLSERMDGLRGLDLPRGMCHQDMHPSNVHLAPGGEITFLDFDGASPGYWLHDVKNFVFGNAFYGFAPMYGEAFERGYLQVRPYTADEGESQELFLLNKAFSLIGGAAATSKSRGRDLLRLRSLDWFADYIKPRARALGLL